MRISDWSSDVCSSDLLVNDRPEDGISGSIIRAVEHVMPMRKCRGILICLADMPDVPQTHYNRICLAAEDIRSVVASTDGFSASPPARSEERRVGKGCVSPCSSRWSLAHKKKKQ